MCQYTRDTDQSSHQKPSDRFDEGSEDIGTLMRDYGQEYIRVYGANKEQIKFIKDVGKCKTPAQGGLVISCRSCNQKTYLYKSCGNSQCPKCQSIKRLQWQDRLSSKILKCPYQHIVFTVPHELNYIARMYPKVVYGTLFKAAWKTIEKLSKSQDNVGGTPGMVGVLHTFGSDLKHHIHLHTLVTFGGIDKKGEWQWPKRKNKLAPYRSMCSEFRSIYLKELHQALSKENEAYYVTVRAKILQLQSVRWCVHNTPPTMHTKMIEEYLGRYICRVGVSNKRLKYDSSSKEVQLEYNDYKHQEINKPAPKAIKKIEPLIAIDQIVTHVLPRGFQKVRYYGIMTASNQKKIAKQIPKLIKADSGYIRKLFEILRALLQLEEGQEIGCIHCGSTDLQKSTIHPDKAWYMIHIAKKPLEARGRSPDEHRKTYKPTNEAFSPKKDRTTYAVQEEKTVEIA